MDSVSLGKFGENKAAEYIKNRGYKILCRNFRCRFGEIDIIASNGKYLAFVEVKLRKNDEFAKAREYVGYSKQKKIRLTAQYYLSCNRTLLQPRFDVIEIYAPRGPEGELIYNYIENAFQ